MRAVQFDLADPSFPASLVDVPPPDLPGPAWARVEVATGGICGSDLHLFTHNTGPSPSLMGLGFAFPFVMGHEIAGRIVEAGPDCGMAEGTKVAVSPTIPCAARGIELCPFCAAGDISSCQRLHVRRDGMSFAVGFSQGMGGGWAEQVVAHRSMLFALADSVEDRGASLHEPLSIAVHGLLRQPPTDGDRVVVVGAGIIGLASAAAVRALFPKCEVTVVARHQAQARAATAVGAHHVVRHAANQGHFEELAALSRTEVLGRGDNSMLLGGFRYGIEAVGSPAAVTEVLRIVDNRGTVLLLGAAGVSEVDLTPVWWKELAFVGAINHSIDPGPDGARRHSVARAVELLAAGVLPHTVVVTHEFGLSDYRRAIETAIDRAAGAIKVVFRPNA